MSLKVRMRWATSPSPVAATRSPGRSRSTRSISAASPSSGRRLARSRSAFSTRAVNNPAPSTATSVATIGADTVTGENTSSADDASRTATLTRNTRRKSPRAVADVPVARLRGSTVGRCSVSTGMTPGSSSAAWLSMRPRTHPKMGVAPDTARSSRWAGWLP